MRVPPGLADFADVIIDSYFIVDRDRNIIDFNGAFRSLLPRAAARKLKSKKCFEVLQLDICREGCIAEQCWRSGAQVRLDEISGRVAGDEREMRFILSAIPIRDDAGELIGAMEVQRNVTDEALVQTKYQQQVEASAQRQRQLEDELHARTRRLLEMSRRYYEAQQSLLKAKTELLG